MQLVRDGLKDAGFHFVPKGCRIEGKHAQLFWRDIRWVNCEENSGAILGTWVHNGEMPKNVSSPERSIDQIWFGRLHEYFGNPLRACEMYKAFHFENKRPYGAMLLHGMVEDYYALQLKINDVDAVWSEYRAREHSYDEKETTFLDLYLMFAQKFIESGRRSMANWVLRDALARETILHHPSQLSTVIALLERCTDKPEFKKAMGEWKKTIEEAEALKPKIN